MNYPAPSLIPHPPVRFAGGPLPLPPGEVFRAMPAPCFLLPWGEGGARERSEWEDEGVRTAPNKCQRLVS